MAQRDHELPAESLDPAERVATLASTPGLAHSLDVASGRTLKAAMNGCAGENRARTREDIRRIGPLGRAAAGAGTPQ